VLAALLDISSGSAIVTGVAAEGKRPRERDVLFG
jgi:hypothetical protein